MVTTTAFESQEEHDDRQDERAAEQRLSDSYGAKIACASPTARPPTSVTQSDYSRPISAASAAITRKVSAAVEGRDEVGEEQARRPGDEAGAEPGGRLDTAHGNAERGGDLAVVGDSAVRRAELRVT